MRAVALRTLLPDDSYDSKIYRRRRKSPVRTPRSRRPIAVGVTTLQIEIANPARPEIRHRLEFTVDSGATYSVVPARVLRNLGIKPHRRESFRLANGASIMRRKGTAIFKYQRWIGGAALIFGEEGDATLLGATTLEAIGLALDPIRRELKPVTLLL